MTELLERVALDLNKTLSSNRKCTRNNESGEKDTARIHDLGATCTPELLLNSMEKAKAEIPKKPQPRALTTKKADALHALRSAEAKAKGEKAPARIQYGYEIDDCKPNMYPFQTHHLIPKAYIKTQPVAKWLTMNAKGSKLEFDTTYDTDSAENGYCLPFFSTTRDWYDARVASRTVSEKTKQKIANQLIVATGKQIHQGDHTAEDFLEQERIESAGYLDMTKRLLNVIADRARDHAKKCKKCKIGQKDLPRSEVVEGMHGVSSILKTNIDAWKIFVCRASAMYRKTPQKDCTPWTKKKKKR